MLLAPISKQFNKQENDQNVCLFKTFGISITQGDFGAYG